MKSPGRARHRAEHGIAATAANAHIRGMIQSTSAVSRRPVARGLLAVAAFIALGAPIAASAQAVAPAQNCREFTTQVIVGGHPQQAVGQACQQPDGTWRVVRETPGLPQQAYTVPPQAMAYGYGYPYAYPYPYPYPYPYYWGPSYAGWPFFFGGSVFLGGGFHHHGFGHGGFAHGGFARGGFHGGGRH